MDRLTLDMEGARRGDLSAASLQLGDDTIAIQRIATMTVEANTFSPYDTSANQRRQGVFATFFVAAMFFAILGLAYFALMRDRPSGLAALFIGGLCLLGGIYCGALAVHYARYLKKREPYYRLVIGTSDGRQIPLVDDNRAILVKIRDIVKYKMDSEDRAVTGDFDLDLDQVNVSLPKGADARLTDMRDAVEMR